MDHGTFTQQQHSHNNLQLRYVTYYKMSKEVQCNILFVAVMVSQDFQFFNLRAYCGGPRITVTDYSHGLQPRFTAHITVTDYMQLVMVPHERNKMKNSQLCSKTHNYAAKQIRLSVSSEISVRSSVRSSTLVRLSRA